MIKKLAFFVILTIVFSDCTNHSKKNASAETAPAEEHVTQDTLAVFPVTDYLLGEIHSLESQPITPLQIVTQGAHSDSVWLKRENIRSLARDFLSPRIDSASLHQYFAGNSFLDQTVGAFTFVYTPKAGVQQIYDLNEIDVYVDPQTNKVQRIYLVKEDGDTTKQLTWKSGSWYSIRTIVNGNVKEEKVKWNFDE